MKELKDKLFEIRRRALREQNKDALELVALLEWALKSLELIACSKKVPLFLVRNAEPINLNRR